MSYRSTHVSSHHHSSAPPNCQHKRFVRKILRVTALIARLCVGNCNALKTSNLRHRLSPMDGRLYRQSRQNKDLTDATISWLNPAADRSERSDRDGPDLTRLIARLCDRSCKALKINNLRCRLSPMDGRLYRQSRQNKDFTGATIFRARFLVRCFA